MQSVTPVLITFLSEDWDSPPAGFTRRPMLLPVHRKLAAEGWRTLAIERPVCPLTTWLREPQKVAQAAQCKKRFRVIEDGLCLATPVLSVHERIADRSGVLRGLNGRLMRAQVSAWLRRMGLQDRARALWLFHPAQSWLIDAVPHDALIYECYDEYAGMVTSQALRKRLHDEESLILSRADLVVTTSEELYKSRSQQNPHTVMVNNGVDYDLFASGVSLPEPEDIASIPHPRICFAGIINRRLDLDLLAELATAHPEWNILMVGPVEEISRQDRVYLDSFDNIRFMGQRRQWQLPAYLGHCDVNIIPYVKNESTAAIYPLKLNEYLAVGRPVVTTAFSKDLFEFKDVVRIASNHTLFVEATADALGEQRECYAVRARAFARRASWQFRAAKIVNAISEMTDRVCGEETCQAKYAQ